MATPEQIKEHAHKYKEGAWRDYSYEELAQWINLLTRRASHRTELKKMEKDLNDANNYLAMLKSKFEENAEKIFVSFERKE